MLEFYQAKEENPYKAEKELLSSLLKEYYLMKTLDSLRENLTKETIRSMRKKKENVNEELKMLLDAGNAASKIKTLL